MMKNKYQEENLTHLRTYENLKIGPVLWFGLLPFYSKITL